MKKKRRRFIWLAVVLAVILLAFLYLRSTQTQRAASLYSEEAVRTGSIETYYSFSGNIAVRDSQNVAAKVNATVREVYASQDDTVTPGQPLLRLSSGDIITADIGGEITDVHVSAGDSVSMGAPLVDIVNFDDLQVVMKVDEYDVAAVTAGKEASVTVGALGLVYDATVEHISKQAMSQMAGDMSGGLSSGSGDVTYYEAKLSAPQDGRLLPGMKVDVKILSERVDNVPVLSMAALQFDAYNKPFVYRPGENATSPVEVPVEVGIQDGTTAQITGGLSVGDVVLIPQQSFLFPMMGGSR